MDGIGDGSREGWCLRPLSRLPSVRAGGVVSRMADLEEVLGALSQSGGAYLVVGGVAVVLHGHPRFTADLDLALRLDRENVLRILGALESLGYRPRAPVAALDFADADLREQWIRDKGLTVFSLWSPRFPATEVDLFVRDPFDFEVAHARALRVDLGGTVVMVAGIEDLIALKKAAGRPRDMEDIAALEAIAGASDAKD
jgi:hypothetical protein